MYSYTVVMESTHNTFFIAQELIRELGDGAFVGTLASDSSNIVTLVRDLYNVSVAIIRQTVYHKLRLSSGFKCFSELL